MSMKLVNYSLAVILLFTAVWRMFQPEPSLANGPDVGVTAILTPATNGRALTSLTLESTQKIAVVVTNFGALAQNNIPISYSVNGTAVATEQVSGPLAAGGSQVYTFTAQVNLSAVGSYAIAAKTALVGDTNPGNDSTAVTVSQLANPPLTIPFHEGFENTGNQTLTATVVGLSGAERVDYANTSHFGRLRTQAGNGFYHSGSHAATLDRASWNGIQINFLTFTLNMAGYDAGPDQILLDFAFMHHGEEFHDHDRVWIRGNDSAAWIEIINLNEIQRTAGVFNKVVGVNLSQILTANGHNYSSSFQIRFGQEDTFPATSPTASDGYTFDDIVLRGLPDVDAGPSRLLLPGQHTCGSMAQTVSIEVTNFGEQILQQIPVIVSVSNDGNGQLAGEAPGPIVFQENDSAQVGSINTRLGGTFTFSASTAVNGDSFPDNDTIVRSVQINPVPIPTIDNGPICAGQSTTLGVSAEPGISYSWYTAPNGGNLLATGPSWTSPPLNQTTTYYVQRQLIPPATVGEDEDPTGTGNASALHTNGLVFDVLSPAIIDAVHVYPSTTGEVVIRLLDSNGQVLDSQSKFVTTPNVKTPIPLGFSVPVGTGYRLDAVGTQNVGLYRGLRNTPYPYPYTSPFLNITGPINNTTAFYYFFYDWEVSSAACTAERTPLTVEVVPSGGQATVTTVADAGPGSLRQVVGNACDGATINFAASLSGQTITLSGGQIPVNRQITVENPHAPGLTISGNNASRMFYVSSGSSLSLSDLSLGHGRVSGTGGGAILNEGGLVNLNRVSLLNNASALDGGALYNDNGGGINILNSALIDNLAENGHGGGIYNNDGTINAGNSTLSGNAAQSDGGGIYNLQGLLNLSNSTLSGNTADRSALNQGDGGGIFNGTGTVAVANTLIAANRDQSSVLKHADVSGDFVSAGHNLIGTNQGLGSGGTPFVDGVNGDQVGSTASPLDPHLDALAGSPAYHPLQAGSPAVEAGNLTGCRFISQGQNPLFGNGTPVTQDQRGVGRPQGSACDIGAIEFQPMSLSITKHVTPSLDVTYRSEITYTIIVTNLGLLDAAGTQVTDTLPANAAFVRWVARPNQATVNGQQVTWQGTIAGGQALPFIFVAQHGGNFGDIVTNVAEYRHPIAGRASAAATFEVEPSPINPLPNSFTYLPLVTKH